MRLKRSLLLAGALGAGVLSGVLAACQSQQVIHQENDLAAAGFTVRIANTAARQAMLNRLPANQFVQRVNGSGAVQFVYADPVACGCLYIGTQQNFNQYVSNQQVDYAYALNMALLDYTDAEWDWGAWGPLEPLGPIDRPGW
jgi:hypothetical protein